MSEDLTKTVEKNIADIVFRLRIFCSSDRIYLDRTNIYNSWAISGDTKTKIYVRCKGCAYTLFELSSKDSHSLTNGNTIRIHNKLSANKFQED